MSCFEVCVFGWWSARRPVAVPAAAWLYISPPTARPPFYHHHPAMPTDIVVPPQTVSLRILRSISASIDDFECPRRGCSPWLVLQWLTTSGCPPAETLNCLVAWLRAFPRAPITPRLTAVLQRAVDLSSDARLRGRDVLREVQFSDGGNSDV